MFARKLHVVPLPLETSLMTLILCRKSRGKSIGKATGRAGGGLRFVGEELFLCATGKDHSWWPELFDVRSFQLHHEQSWNRRTDTGKRSRELDERALSPKAEVLPQN